MTPKEGTSIVYTNGQHVFLVREPIDEVLARLGAGAVARLTLAGGGEDVAVLSHNVTAITVGHHIVGDLDAQEHGSTRRKRSR